MIAVDTSALLAIVLDEPVADQCVAALERADTVLISAATLAETLIVGARRNLGTRLPAILERFAFEVIDVTPASAKRIAGAYERWGRGLNPAGLNFGDCFAYEVATEHDCPLLYVGNDFAKTDVRSAL